MNRKACGFVAASILSLIHKNGLVKIYMHQHINRIPYYLYLHAKQNTYNSIPIPNSTILKNKRSHKFRGKNFCVALSAKFLLPRTQIVKWKLDSTSQIWKELCAQMPTHPATTTKILIKTAALSVFSLSLSHSLIWPLNFHIGRIEYTRLCFAFMSFVFLKHSKRKTSNRIEKWRTEKSRMRMKFKTNYFLHLAWKVTVARSNKRQQ